MAEIIDDRARPPFLFWKYDCKACHSSIKVTTDDIEFGKWKVGGYWFNGTEQIEERYTWTCPACSFENNKVDPESVPEGVKQDARKAYLARKANGDPII